MVCGVGVCKTVIILLTQSNRAGAWTELGNKDITKIVGKKCFFPFGAKFFGTPLWGGGVGGGGTPEKSIHFKSSQMFCMHI